MELFIIPTPIGNLQDITLRALETLKNVDAVFCEDTRRTLQMLNHYGIKKRLFRYNEHDERSLAAAIGFMRCGKTAALTTDGGSPCISDPGFRLVAECRRAGIRVTPLPGPSAVITAAAGSGLPADSFIFLGFLPRSRGKMAKALRAAFSLGKTVILYESPYRIAKFMSFVSEEFGENTQAVIARELTKIHEEFISGTAGEIAARLNEAEEIKGEFAVLLRPGPEYEEDLTD
ncbi:MAG: 16S rRNA (cytidine(1402)-2'-O)-methyltransferase [Elusimicrobiales bacterium]|nr:16S rRNA (cytidine(1402)-2'-O)-methyltransferase [Elusimicrobiales bacterium]